MKRILTFALLFYFGTVNAQYITKYKKIADQFYNQKDYYAAANFYKKALNIDSADKDLVKPYSFNSRATKSVENEANYQEAIYNLAYSSKAFKFNKDAEQYFKIATKFTNEKFIDANYYYAESLMFNSKYQEAKQSFKKYIEIGKVDSLIKKAEREIENCDFAIKAIEQPKLVTYTKLQNPINNGTSNYASAIKNDSFYFTSSRVVDTENNKGNKKNKGKLKIKLDENTYKNKIFVTNLTDSSSNIKQVNLVNENSFDMASVTFNPKGDVIYYTAWSADQKHAIYQSKLVEGIWSSPEKLNDIVNVEGFNTIQPFVTPDGQKLLFSSNRPGGLGNYDIWYCTISDDGKFSNAINLGPNINTADDERSPYFNTENKNLIFASNGRVGLGGFDLYLSKGEINSLSKPKNMGFPLNSAKDDLYFTSTEVNDNRGFISSERSSDCCIDLYSIERKYITIEGRLTDSKTLMPIEGVKVYFENLGDDEVITTGTDGKYSFKIDNKESVRMLFVKDNYFNLKQDITKNELNIVDSLLVKNLTLTEFKINKAIVLDNIYYEFNTADLTESSKEVLNELIPILKDNPNMIIELSAHTDALGSDEYNQKLSDARAQSCVDYLISQNIDANQLEAKGYGEKFPIAPNTFKNGVDNPIGRAKNRRTEFKVLKK